MRRKNLTSVQQKTLTNTIDGLLHDADRAQGGADFARRMGDHKNSDGLTARACLLYEQALAIDPTMADLAWDEDGNRDAEWLRWAGLDQIANRKKVK